MNLSQRLSLPAVLFALVITAQEILLAAQHGMMVYGGAQLVRRQQTQTCRDPLDRVCATTLSDGRPGIQCAPVCCYDSSQNFLNGCQAGDYCKVRGSDLTCCPNGVPESECSPATACVNADKTAPPPTSICPTNTPLCFTRSGAAGCSGSYGDYLTLIATAPAPPPASSAAPPSTSTPAPPPNSAPAPLPSPSYSTPSPAPLPPSSPPYPYPSSSSSYSSPAPPQPSSYGTAPGVTSTYSGPPITSYTGAAALPANPPAVVGVAGLEALLVGAGAVLAAFGIGL